MSLLHDQLVAQGCIASVLYSDVGDFYARCTRLPMALAGDDPSGWHVEGATHAEWPVSTSDPALSSSSLQARPLTETHLDDVAALDSRLLMQQVDAAAEETFCILPSGAGFEWRLVRSKIYEQNLNAQGKRDGLPSLAETGWGVELGSRDEPESWAFVLWAYDLAENELIILRLRFSSEEQLRALVAKAADAARAQKMKKVTAWNLDRKIAEKTGARIVDRKEHLPALAWYGEGQRPRWVNNENWAWC